MWNVFFPLACCQAGSPLSALASHGRHGKKEMDDGLCCCCCAHEEIPLLSFHSMGTSLYDDRGDLFIHPSSSAPRSFPPHSFWSFFSFPFCRKEIRLVCCTGSTATSSSSDGQQWLLGPGHPAGVARASLGSAPLWPPSAPACLPQPGRRDSRWFGWIMDGGRRVRSSH
jgi:hypothetical protein